MNCLLFINMIITIIILKISDANNIKEGIWSIHKNSSFINKKDDISHWHIQTKTFSNHFQKLFSSNGLNNIKNLMKNLNIVFIGNL